MTEDINDSLVRKIRALMAKAEGTTNEHEAEAFAAKVQELLAKHNLSIDMMREEARDDVGVHYFNNEWKSPARKALFWAVCRFYMCKGIGPGRGSSTWTVVGRKHNVVVAIEMSRYLVSTVLRLSNEHGKRTGATGAQVIDYRRGAFQRLSERLDQMRKDAVEAEAPKWNADGNPGNLPALVTSEKALINAALAATGVKVVNKNIKITHKTDHAMAGRAAAENIGIQRQVHGGGAGRLMIGNK